MEEAAIRHENLRCAQALGERPGQQVRYRGPNGRGATQGSHALTLSTGDRGASDEG